MRERAEMSEDALREFVRRREDGNERVLRGATLSIRRFFALDHDAYAEGALTRREKELLGLAASMVLRCDDCVAYHLREAHACGAERAAVVETLGVALVVGGSITIPHLRHAFEIVDALWGELPATPDGKT
ncbi:MAG: carboxymuconolactone decarboxylase family protein [Candidatus Bipolaricaulota bacterium]